MTDFGLSLALLSLFPLAAPVALAAERLPGPLCAFRLVTGQPCPFCGLTRAFAMAWAGRWGDAFAFHPLWPLAAGVVLAIACLFANDAARRGRRARDLLQAGMRRWAAAAALLVVFEVMRIWGC